MARVHIGFEGCKTLPKLTRNTKTWIPFFEAAIVAVEAGNYVDLSMNGNLQDWNLDEPGSKNVPFEHETGITRLFLDYEGKYYTDSSLPWPERLKLFLHALKDAADLELTDDYIDSESDSFKTRDVFFTGSDTKTNPDA